MFEKNDYIKQLIGKHFGNELTPEEHKELEAWLAETEANRELLNSISDDKLMDEKLKLFLAPNVPSAWAKLEQQIGTRQSNVIKSTTPTKKKYWPWIAVAALVVLSIGLYNIWINNSILRNKKAQISPDQSIHALPQISNEAELTLSDGTIISLNSNKKNTIAPQGVYQVKINKDDLYYKISDLNSSSEKEIYNTITTLNRRQFRVIFTDGKSANSIRMNVASCLKFNVSKAVQKVSLKGEAEFEIAHKYNNKFLVMIPSVKKNGIENKVEVTGTRFNINAYENDGLQKITLLGGTINVSATGNQSSEVSTALLKMPCQQAQINENGIINIIPRVDTTMVTEWKKGTVSFNRISTLQLFKLIEKWYDINIVYKNTNVPNCLFTGRIAPDTDIESVLNIMQFQCDNLHIKYDSTINTISVLP